MAYRAIVWFLRALVGVFFKRIEVTGLGNIPVDRGGIIVAWHPNGMVDPGLILTHFPRQVVFGARDGLFKVPVLATILRSIGTVPIFRTSDSKSQDPEIRRAANKASLEGLAREVVRGSFSALFPEGVSHDSPHPVEMKTGAARLYYRAREMLEEGGKTPVIIPVGLHYDRKMRFRSTALVAFHPPLELPPDLDVVPDSNEDIDESRARGRKLTEVIERELHEAVHATEDWSLHYLMHRSRSLIRAERAHRLGAEPGPQSLEEKTLGFARVRAAYLKRLESDPAVVEKVKARVEAYDRDIRSLGLKDHELDQPPPLTSPWLTMIILLQVIAVFLVMPPILLLGYIINLPSMAALWVLASVVSKLRKDVASVKILVGAVLFPTTWAIFAGLAYWGHTEVLEAFPSMPDSRIATAWFTFMLGGVGGAVALRYQHAAGETIRAVRVRITRGRRWFSVARLKKERAQLTDVLTGLSEGVDLPGTIAEDGSIRAGMEKDDREDPDSGIDLSRL